MVPTNLLRRQRPCRTSMKLFIVSICRSAASTKSRIAADEIPCRSGVLRGKDRGLSTATGCRLVVRRGDCCAREKSREAKRRRQGGYRLETGAWVYISRLLLELPCHGSTNTEPGAVATGSASVEFIVIVKLHSGDIVYGKSDPVATAPGSVFVDPQCKWTQ
mgnify:CR=1 FL=1